jgi:outer membrane cobalamin receptor
VKLRGKLLAGLIIAVGSQSCLAAGQGNSLDEVQVLGTQIEESIPVDLQKYGSRLEVITSEQLTAGGYNDLSQALQMLVPGLYVAPKNGPFDYVDASLLGSRTGDILYLIDGVRISNRLYNGTTPLDTIPAHMIERIEVLKGGQGLFYGTNAVAGVINVITKSYSDKTDLGVSAGIDTNDGKHADAYVRGRLGDSRIVLFGSYDKADGFQPFRDQDYQPSSTDRHRSYDVHTAGVKFAHPFSEQLTLSALYQYTDATLDFASPTLSAKDINARWEQLLSVKLDYAMSDNVGFYLKTYYHDWTTHYTTIENDLNGAGQLTGTQTVTYPHLFWGFTDQGVNLMTRINLHQGLEYLAGFDLQRYSGRDEVYTIAPLTEEVKALYAQLRTTDDWLPNTHLALGARYNKTAAGPAATVWNLSGRHDFNAHLYLRGTGGTSFRLPDAYQLYGAFINEFDTLGNPQLKPEKSTNIDLGLGGTGAAGTGTWNWEVTGFMRSIRDLIGSEDDGFTDVDHDGNDDYDTVAVNTNARVKMSGGELQLGLTLSSGWTINLDHTYSRARPDGSDLQIDRIPLSHSRLSLDYRPAASRYSAGISSVWVGDVYQNANGIRTNYGKYAVVDAWAGAYLDAGHHHKLGVSIGNLFDKEYATRLGTASRDDGSGSYAYWNLGAPRTFQLRYGYTLGAK